MNACCEPTVFVVDDDPAVCNALRFFLQLAGLRVETFLKAQEFLDAYDPRHSGCLLLDVNIPGMDGLELQEELIVRQSPLPVIFITGHGSAALRDRVLKKGAVGFIEKPFLSHDLLNHVRSALEQTKHT